jgi:hypothetical protein
VLFLESVLVPWSKCNASLSGNILDWENADWNITSTDLAKVNMTVQPKGKLELAFIERIILIKF